MSDLLTAIPEARTALLNLLRSRPGLDGVQIERAHPGKDRVQARAIWLGTVENAEQHAAAIGAKKRREEFSIQLVVSVERPGNDIDATEAALWPIVREVAAAVREDKTLGDAVGLAEVVPLSFDHFPGESKRLAEVELGIACKAFRV